MKLGVFGGTFDPPHLGHLVVAQEVHFRLGLDTVLWVPAAIPPHKTGQAITHGSIRLEMVRAAIEGDDRFQASDIELRRDGPSYTVDTLRQLRDERPDDALFLIVGADQLAELSTWREPEAVLELATLVGFARDGVAPAAPEGARIVAVPRLDISSTAVRARRARGEPVRYLVHGDVEGIMGREQLYSAGRGGA
jgi:nicotinate-nucleotide adenylyltransferase